MVNRVAVLVFVVPVVMGFVMSFVVTVNAGFSGLDRFVVRGVGFDVGAFLRTERVDFFDSSGFFGAFVGNFDFVDSANFLGFFFVVLVVFLECGATNDGVGGSVCLNFVLFRVDDAGSESVDFVVTECRFRGDFVAVAGVFELVSGSAIVGSFIAAFGGG